MLGLNLKNSTTLSNENHGFNVHQICIFIFLNEIFLHYSGFIVRGGRRAAGERERKSNPIIKRITHLKCKAKIALK